MARFAPIGLAMAAALIVAGGSAPAQTGRPVPTETITVPQGAQDRAMPGIPDLEVATEPTSQAFADADLLDIHYDPEDLPTPVRRLREQIIAAAATGNPDNLKPIIAANDVPPAFSFGHVEDPIAYLKSLSGDPEGREIMAILIEVLEAGFVHADVGTPEEMYVWPYFARYPVEALTPEQIVELFKLVYAGDYEDMKAYGYYLSYRLGIAPDGTWSYFIAGD